MDTMSAVKEVADEIQVLIQSKNKHYKNNFASLGLRGLYVGLHRKMGRIRNMIWDNPKEPIPPEVREELVDLASLSMLAVVLIDHPELEPDPLKLDDFFDRGCPGIIPSVLLDDTSSCQPKSRVKNPSPTWKTVCGPCETGNHDMCIGRITEYGRCECNCGVTD